MLLKFFPILFKFIGFKFLSLEKEELMKKYYLEN